MATTPGRKKQHDLTGPCTHFLKADSRSTQQRSTAYFARSTIGKRTQITGWDDRNNALVDQVIFIPFPSRSASGRPFNISRPDSDNNEQVPLRRIARHVCAAWRRRAP